VRSLRGPGQPGPLKLCRPDETWLAGGSWMLTGWLIAVTSMSEMIRVRVPASTVTILRI
jgi:hypothetical protein